jgi:hypothetical protein
MDERNGAEDAIGRRDERGAIDELLCFALLRAAVNRVD